MQARQPEAGFLKMSCKLIFAAFHDVSRMVRMLLLKSLIRRKSAHTVLLNGMSHNGAFAT
jgi:hypothetical protein